VSLFSNVERYGINMARLLPAIIKCEDWRLAAKVNVGGGEKLFRLSPRTGLRSHYRDEPVFDSAPEEAFYNKFVRNSKSKWTIEREGSVLDLKDTVLIPDFKFTHKKDGRVAHLEIIGFWTPEYLAKKLDKLSRVKEANIVVAVPESLNCSKDTFSGPVVRYKQRLLIKDVLPAVEEAAKAGDLRIP
jgi:predicted nuclease of restriction endonuclease-like RecB superfamily